MKVSHDLNPALKAKSRLITAGVFEFFSLIIGLRPEWDYGIYDKTKFWYAFDNSSKEFLVVLLPTAAIVFLFPLVVRGSLPQKIGAVILALPAALVAIPIWLEIIRRFIEIR